MSKARMTAEEVKGRSSNAEEYRAVSE